MTKLSLIACAAAAVFTTLAAPVVGLAQTKSDDDKAALQKRNSQCFFVTDFDQWRDVDDKTLYFHTHTGGYYRLDMANSCPELTYPEPRLITQTRGPSTMCSAVDWDLRMANGSGPPGFATPCIVKEMTRLTPEEAAALPKKYKPY